MYLSTKNFRNPCCCCITSSIKRHTDNTSKLSIFTHDKIHKTKITHLWPSLKLWNFTTKSVLIQTCSKLSFPVYNYIHAMPETYKLQEWLDWDSASEPAQTVTPQHFYDWQKIRNLSLFLGLGTDRTKRLSDCSFLCFFDSAIEVQQTEWHLIKHRLCVHLTRQILSEGQLQRHGQRVPCACGVAVSISGQHKLQRALQYFLDKESRTQTCRKWCKPRAVMHIVIFFLKRK